MSLLFDTPENFAKNAKKAQHACMRKRRIIIKRKFYGYRLRDALKALKKYIDKLFVQ